MLRDCPICALFMTGLMLFLLWIMSLVPVFFYAEKLCLEQGYPKAFVTYDYAIYCTTLDGAVTVKVEKQ